MSPLQEILSNKGWGVASSLLKFQHTHKHTHPSSMTFLPCRSHCQEDTQIPSDPASFSFGMVSSLPYVTTKSILPMHSHIPVPVLIPWRRRDQADVVVSQANRRKVESRGAHTGVQANVKHVAFSADSFCFPAQGWPGNLVCHRAVLALVWVQKTEGGPRQLTQWHVPSERWEEVQVSIAWNPIHWLWPQRTASLFPSNDCSQCTLPEPSSSLPGLTTRSSNAFSKHFCHGLVFSFISHCFSIFSLSELPPCPAHHQC